jgi:hypothetical protein
MNQDVPKGDDSSMLRDAAYQVRVGPCQPPYGLTDDFELTLYRGSYIASC